MDDLIKGSIWTNKKTLEKIKVLDFGIWVLSLDTKKPKTIDFSTLIEEYEKEKDK